jgi:hypothetical protein
VFVVITGWRTSRDGAVLALRRLVDAALLVLTLFDELVREGHLVREGERRGTRYVLASGGKDR